MNKKNSKNSNSVYKLVTSATLLLPLPIYLFLMATLFSITPDYTVYTEIENVEVVEYKIEKEDVFFLIAKDNAKINGIVDFYDGKYGIYIDEEDIIKIDKNYYSYVLKDNQRQLVDIKKFEIQKQQSYKVPLSFFISLLGVLFVVLIVQGKMQWPKKHPRLAAFVALLTGTVILLILNAIISNILGVFIVATSTWGVYCLEYFVHQGMLDESEKDKKESEIIRALKGMLDNE